MPLQQFCSVLIQNNIFFFYSLKKYIFTLLFLTERVTLPYENSLLVSAQCLASG